MKKIFMSVGALLFAGVLLASCDNNGVKITKLNKGKSVDKVSFKCSGEDFEFSNNSKVEDIIDELSGVSLSAANYEENKYTFAYKHNLVSSSTNGLTDGGVAKKITANMSTTNIVDYYEKTNDSNGETSSETYLYNEVTTKSTGAIDGDTQKEEYKTVSGFAGSYFSNSDKVEVDFGTYNTSSSVSASNTKTEKKSEKSVSNAYKYLNKSENRRDEDFGKTYVGYDENGSMYYYNIQTFYNIGYYAYTTPDFSVSDLYNENYKDYFKPSFELTDKYIILKSESTYNSSAEQFAAELLYFEGKKEYSSEELVSKTKDVLKDSFKNLKEYYEIWIDYTIADENLTDNSNLGYAYYKHNVSYKVNTEITYNENVFDWYKNNTYQELSDEVKKEAMGLKAKATGTISSSREFSYNTNDYSKKIKTTKKQCKKNNIFDKITMVKM